MLGPFYCVKGLVDTPIETLDRDDARDGNNFRTKNLKQTATYLPNITRNNGFRENKTC